MTESTADEGTGGTSERKLYLEFHGRVIEHLGIQMYQSPVNAIAELVANAWDADATSVEIELPRKVTDPNATFMIRDNGIGMTFEECQKCYLTVGRNRRGDATEERTARGRPVLGRKGIGKFAGFGIASLVTVETVSGENGERTVFRLDLDDLMSDDEPQAVQKEIEIVEYDLPDEERKQECGTEITLSRLTIHRAPSRNQFPLSMARRFLLHEGQAEFVVSVQGAPLPQSYDAAGFEYQFPKDLPEPIEGVKVDEEGWGLETVGGEEIRWRFLFRKDTIEEEELKGIAVFAGGKLVQRPFFFNLTRGLTGQHGAEYLAGQVVADFIDRLPTDLIATERQRVNWAKNETTPLLDWGQSRLRFAFRVWAKLRGREKARHLEEQLVGFADRLERLPKHEKKTVKRALTSLGKVPTLTSERFDELGRAVLGAWEHGRLTELIAEIAESEDLDEPGLLDVLVEARVLTALQTVEVVRTKLEAIQGLRRRIEEKELENAVRDFIAENPWLVSPEWETFKRETGLRSVTKKAANASKLSADVYRGRVDLTMASGHHLLVLEFVRPGLPIDWDHLSRFERYVRTIRSSVRTTTAADFRQVTGYIVADRLDRGPEFTDKIEAMKGEDMYALNWSALLAKAEAGWRDFLDILEVRGGGDFRMEGHFDAVRHRERNQNPPAPASVSQERNTS
ncbi:MAG: ATP-binding protein [Bacteroidetes bacterium]|nr:ATP-binding protein [Bacteroidota bacterium]